MQFKKKALTGAALALASAASFAQTSGGSTGPDVSSVVTAIQGCAAAIAAIGLAALAIHFGAKLYKWIRSAA